jgi:predicted DNA-binding ribbon-helix-helix protein
VSLEDPFWLAFRQIARERKTPLNVLAAEIDTARGFEIGLASAIRIFVLQQLQAKCVQQKNAGDIPPS